MKLTGSQLFYLTGVFELQSHSISRRKIDRVSYIIPKRVTIVGVLNESERYSLMTSSASNNLCRLMNTISESKVDIDIDSYLVKLKLPVEEQKSIPLPKENSPQRGINEDYLPISTRYENEDVLELSECISNQSSENPYYFFDTFLSEKQIHDTEQHIELRNNELIAYEPSIFN